MKLYANSSRFFKSRYILALYLPLLPKIQAIIDIIKSCYNNVYCQKIEPISHNTSINSHNNVFNISLFLNEDCKDAMNMSDFIESIQLSIEDLEKIGSEGQTQALSNILTDRLNDLEVVKRPVHCSDPKKEIIYVKDEGKWEKEPKHNPNLKKALDKITMESMYKIPGRTRS